jgi:hypothetical protein
MGMAAVLLVGYLIFGGNDGCEDCVIINDAQHTTVTITAEEGDKPAVQLKRVK